MKTVRKTEAALWILGCLDLLQVFFIFGNPRVLDIFLFFIFWENMMLRDLD